MKKIIYHNIVSIISKIILWIGITIILSSVGYAIINLSNIDDFIAIWAILMTIGVCFSFVSTLLKTIIKLSDKKKAF